MRYAIAATVRAFSREQQRIDEVATCVSDNVRILVPRRMELKIIAPNLSGSDFVVPKFAHSAKMLVDLGSDTPDSAAVIPRIRSVIPKNQERFSEAEDVTMASLGDLAELVAKSRKTEPWYPDSRFISVLHVIGEGLLDVANIRAYAPKTPGYPVQPGEVLLSKINPRIPRVTVVPQFAARTLCSTEFEVMKPHEGTDPYHLAYLLLTDVVQHQIRSLTSGTSASHNRIRAEELERVKVPLPIAGSPAERRFHKLMTMYRSTIESMFKETVKLSTLRDSEEFWADNEKGRP